MMRNPLARVACAAMLVTTVAGTVHAQRSATVPSRPTPGPEKAYVFPKVETQTLPNGLKLAVVVNHDLPLVTVRIGLLGGASLDLPSKEGGWGLMINSLREGTTTRTAAQIVDAAAELGTTYTWSAPTSQLSAVSFTTVRSEWRPALDLIADVFMHPAFPAAGVTRAQAALALTAARPLQQTLAYRIALANLYGANHPYARFTTDSSIRRVTLEDVTALHSSYVRPENAVVVIAGDITLGEARAAVEAAFGSWQRGGTPITSEFLPATAQPTQTTIYLRDVPGAAQSVVYGITAAPNRGADDAAPLEIVNHILGGTSGSRIWDAFRTTQGLSYSTFTSIQWRPDPQGATWVIPANVPTAKTDSAVVALMRVVVGVHGGIPLTAGELAFSRKSQVGFLNIDLEAIAGVANRTLSMLQNRLPETFYRDYAGRLDALALPALQAAATRYMDSDHLVIAVVGDRAKIEAPLRATGIPVVIVDK